MSASLIGHSGSSAFRTIHHCNVDVARGLALLYGLGSAPRPFQHGNSKTGWNNLSGGLAVRRTAGPRDRTNSPHPSSREGHRSTARWNSRFLLLHLIFYGPHAAAASRVQRNSVPSTHMRCMITANRRVRATIAFRSEAEVGRPVEPTDAVAIDPSVWSGRA
jgi:hypothetical protein